ncbi:MAG: transposase [Bacteroidetes bacterium]|nr:transposase [Bacteroidota bacterium]
MLRHQPSVGTTWFDVKKGTIADATILESANRPLSKKKREVLAVKPSVQIDTDAQSTEKNGNKYFGYKGHIGVDVGSKLIRKRKFTPANVHDSRALEDLLSGDEKVFGQIKPILKTNTKLLPEN